MTVWKSTRSGATATLTEALFQGPAADGGLYIPATLPALDARAVVRNSRSFQDTALAAARGLIGDEVPTATLEEIVAEALNFPVPLVAIGDDLHVLELFHGPTAAFKDVGARFMAALMDRLDPEPDRTRVVLVATSGDTGGAVAAAFAGRPRFKVIVLFPEGGVSEEQRRLFTTLGGNVTSVELTGDFDDCQALVKQAFRSPDAGRLGLTAANSINVGRLIPQTFYYMDAIRQGGWSDGAAFAIPSGNLGNLTAGMMAAMAGLPIRKLISALNSNDTFLRHLATGAAEPRPTKRTISSAMDVSVPSNLERLDALAGDLGRLRELVWARAFDDDATRACMKRMRAERGYLLDPHTAVAVLGAEAYRRKRGDTGPTVVLSTAHPAKLPDVVEEAVGERPVPPPGLAATMDKEERIVRVDATLAALLDLIEEAAGGRVVAGCRRGPGRRSRPRCGCRAPRRTWEPASTASGSRWTATWTPRSRPAATRWSWSARTASRPGTTSWRSRSSVRSLRAGSRPMASCACVPRSRWGAGSARRPPRWWRGPHWGSRPRASRWTRPPRSAPPRRRRATATTRAPPRTAG